ncbi:MAG: FliH/SctL family protein [Bryobacteraceae bacterium]
MWSRILREDRAVEPYPWAGAAAAPPRQAPAPRPDASGSEAEHTLAELQKQAEQRAQEARQAGRREGEQAARKALEAEVRAALEKLAAALHETAALRQGIMARAESQLLQLAVAIARRVLHRELTVDPEALEALVHSLLERIAAQEVLRVRVFPEHEQALRAALAKLPGAAHLEIRPDPSLGRGGVLLETTRGTLDGSVETQLTEIERGLTDRLRRYGA